jgi:anti-sigma-K factor RskA
MTTGDSMSDSRDCAGDAAAYVLGALEPSEAEEFRRHLASCLVCRDEVAAFGHVVDALPLAAPPQPVPKALRRRVMRDVQAAPRRTPAARRRRRPLLPAGLRPGPALTGGLIVAALAILAGLALVPGGSGGTRVIQASVRGSAGQAQLRVIGARAELIVSHFPPPPAGRIYEVWTTRGRQAPKPTRTLFSVTAGGAADVGVPGGLRGVSTIMVTQEPTGGSLVPTHAPVIVVRLTSE